MEPEVPLWSWLDGPYRGTPFWTGTFPGCEQYFTPSAVSGFIEITNGSCASNLKSKITTREICVAAAKALGKSDFGIKYSYYRNQGVPDGCTYSQTPYQAWLGHLLLNDDDRGITSCSPDHACLCQEPS